MLEIQMYIDTFDDIKDANEALGEQFAINIREETLTVPETEWSSRRHTVYIYNYTKDSPMGIPIAQEARGLVLDKHANVVSSSFKHIPELNSSNAAHVDWSTAWAKIQKDGVLVVVYCFKGKWFVQTRESANADNALPACGISYRAYVHSILKELFGAKDPFKPFCDYLDDDLCYAFEFTSPYTKKVTPYRESNLTLLAAFNKISGGEKPAGWLNAFNIDFAERKLRFINSHLVNDVGDVQGLIASMEPTCRGVIVCDELGNRVKASNPRYKELKRIVDIGSNLTPKHIAKAVIDGPGTQLGAINEAYNEVTNMFFDSMVELSNEIVTIWDANRVFGQDYFANSIKDYPKITRSVLFMLRRGQVDNVREAFERMKPELAVKVARKKYGTEFDEKFEEMTNTLKTWRSLA